MDWTSGVRQKCKVKGNAKVFIWPEKWIETVLGGYQ